MTKQNKSPSQEIDYKAWHKAAWDEVRQFNPAAAKSEQDYFGPNNPQHRLASEFFQFYLENKPSKNAENALQMAFTMWSNLRGVSEQAQEALKHISYEEDVWKEIGHCLLRIFNQAERADEGLRLLEKFLNIGQPAPHFRLQDIDRNTVDLADHQGKIVVLHFWGTTCGACKFIYPDLREMPQEFSTDAFVLVGISDDRDFEMLRTSISEEKFTWPQICEGNGWDDTVFRLYNVTSLPSVYVIDQSGNIACKMVGGNRGEELRETVRSLIA